MTRLTNDIRDRKLCGNCKETKTISAFPWRNKARGKRGAHCKMCVKEAARVRRGSPALKKKTCNTCNESKFMSDFPWRTFGKARQDKCKACQRLYSKSHWQRQPQAQKDRHRERAKARKARIVEENKTLLVSYYKDHPCVDCGEADVLFLESDHVRGKKRRAVSDMLRRGMTWKSISAELEKCETRCVRCHRKKTAETLGWWRAKLG